MLGKKIGMWNGQPVWWVEESISQNFNYVSLRSLLHLPEQQFCLLNRAIGLNHFFKTHQFCGKCGRKVQFVKNEWAVQCVNESCGQRFYPVICPSIIVVVRRGQEMLLVNHLRHKGGIYTAVAGFVEIGETFEQCVQREVLEETGIKIKNIRYFGSQPWSFPNSQMVGFLADYDSGELKFQVDEIYDGKWQHCDDPFPELPPKGTIALQLIEATVALCKIEKISKEKQ